MTTHWIVCVRTISAGEDVYLGPYRTEEGAQRVARRLLGDIRVRGASELLDAIVEPVRSGGDVEEFRDEMLKELDRLGYMMVRRS